MVRAPCSVTKKSGFTCIWSSWDPLFGTLPTLTCKIGPYALRKKELSYFPANPMHVAIYLQYVLESTRSSASVDTAFYSIKWAHESAGLVSPTDNPLVNRVRDAAKRILGTKRGNRKEPLCWNSQG